MTAREHEWLIVMHRHHDGGLKQNWGAFAQIVGRTISDFLVAAAEQSELRRIARGLTRSEMIGHG